MSAGPMNAERLLAHYEKIADAPDAIARLRRFVLDLAVRGKLVPQDPNDEPASELLKRIAKEKARLVKAGAIRKPKVLPDVEKPPFDLPLNWRWTPIREVASDRGQEIPQSAFTYIDVTAIDKEAGVVADPKVLEASEAPSRARKITRKGDVIYSCVRPYLLNVAVIETDFDPQPIVSTAFAILNGHGLVVPRYIWIALRSPFMVACVEENQRGQAYPAINDADFAVLPFPLPPLAEQRRIVAKVDELMALCDRLEAARAGREAVRDRLAAASLARLNAPDPETFQDDARFALEALPDLTTRPDQIKRLRQTILNLAVRGKLVPQDSKEKVAKRYDAEPQSDSFPPNWRLLNFEKFCDIQGGNQPPKSRFIDQPKEGYVRLLQIRDLGERPVPTFIPIGSTNRFCKEGEILIGRYGASVGKIFWAKDGAYNVALAKFIWPQDALIAPFAFLLLKSAYFQDHLAGATRSAQAGFNKGDLAAVNFPLPPLGEQRRISAKMDELTALCDRLEASLTATAATSRRLLDALLAEALAPAEDREMEAAE